MLFISLSSSDDSICSGCLLAHFMGLGKSLTTITVLHTALKSPSLRSSSGKQLFHTVLMIVPANTLTNWANEVDKWTGKLKDSLFISNLTQVKKDYREMEIKKWKGQGGLLIMSDMTFVKSCDSILKAVQPDILVLDEAHTMLKSKSTQIFKKLAAVKTERKILLTGTPYQNNLTEYFQLLQFIRRAPQFTEN